jgi:hypothetical protein
MDHFEFKLLDPVAPLFVIAIVAIAIVGIGPKPLFQQSNKYQMLRAIC